MISESAFTRTAKYQVVSLSFLPVLLVAAFRSVELLELGGRVEFIIRDCKLGVYENECKFSFSIEKNH